MKIPQTLLNKVNATNTVSVARATIHNNKHHKGGDDHEIKI
jgi:hypothetical protein